MSENRAFNQITRNPHTHKTMPQGISLLQGVIRNRFPNNLGDAYNFSSQNQVRKFTKILQFPLFPIFLIYKVGIVFWLIQVENKTTILLLAWKQALSGSCGGGRREGRARRLHFSIFCDLMLVRSFSEKGV